MEKVTANEFRALCERVINLEELFAHEERKVHQLNQVVVELRHQLDAANTQLAQLQARFRWVLENSSGDENLPHEKPPHY